VPFLILVTGSVLVPFFISPVGGQVDHRALVSRADDDALALLLRRP